MTNKTQLNECKSILLKSGFLLPTTPEDIEYYERAFGSTLIVLPEEFNNPDFLFEDKNIECSQRSKVCEISSAPPKDYFKKLVLSAAIAGELYMEPTFGHVKFVKISYLCEQVCNMQLSTNYAKHAAGPLDPKRMYSVDAEFKKRKWFKIKARPGNKGYCYEPDINFSEYQKYYIGYFSQSSSLIIHVIELLRKKSSAFCEIVATFYFIWKELKIEKAVIDHAILVNRFYSWGIEKKKFSIVELNDALKWMEHEQIVPAD